MYSNGRIRKTASFCALMMILSLSACAKNADIDENKADIVIEETENAENLEAENLNMTEDEKKSFARGIENKEESSKNVDSNLEEAPSENESEKKADEIETDKMEADEKEADGKIEVYCPESVTIRRADVKYSEFKHATYYSDTCGMDRGYNILLPASYSEEKKYPVLYLLHGIFGDENSMTDPANKIQEITANLAADGCIEEMIVVCPNMFAADDPNQQPDFTKEGCLPYDNFINDLVDDLMPHIESEYSVLTGRDNTYLAGFSMGGRETIYITLQRPELFGYVCAISAAPGIVPAKDRFMEHEGQISEEEMCFREGAVEPEAFIICCGTSDSVVGKFPKSYHELLEKNGANHIWYEIPGADHDNKAIRSGIYNLLKTIGLN